MLGITKGGHWGWTSVPTVLWITVAVALFLVWLPWEFRAKDPLVDLRTSLKRTVLLTNATSILVGFAMYSNLLTTTALLQIPESTGYGFGFSVMQAGLGMAPAAFAMFAFAPVAALVTRLSGPKVTLILGAVVLSLGYLLRIFLMHSAWQVCIGAVIVSVGTILAFSSMPIIIMDAVPVSETAAANGLNTVLRSMGMATASATVAAILTTVTITIGQGVFPTQAAFQHIFLVAAIAAAAGAVIAWCLPSRGQPSPLRVPSTTVGAA